MKKYFLGNVCVYLFISIPMSASAAIITSSNFDAGTDGWTWDPGQDAAFSWQPAGGNPDGYIRYDDNLDTGIPGSQVILAPAVYHGDWQTMGVTHLTYEQNFFTTGSVAGLGVYYVTISGPGGSAEWYGPTVEPAIPWREVNVPIEEASWTVNSGTWSAMLSDVTELRIQMENITNWTPFEITGVDNVRLNAVPIPAAAWLFGSALLGLVGVAKRKKSA